MKKYFILFLSTIMLCACGGKKTQDNANEESIADTDINADALNGDEGDSAGQVLICGCASVGDDQLEAIEDISREEFYMAQEFLMEVLYPGEGVDTYSEEWITAHCTPEIKQFLRDQYDYDGEGYAKWLMEGDFAGEGEYETEVIGFGYGERHGKPVYAIEKKYSFEGMEGFVRNLYFGLQRNGEDFVISSFEMNLEENDPTVKALSEL